MTGFILFFLICVLLLILLTFYNHYSAKIDEAIEECCSEEKRYNNAEFNYSKTGIPNIAVKRITDRATEILKHYSKEFSNSAEKEISEHDKEQAYLIALILVEMDMRTEGWYCFDEEKLMFARKVEHYYEQLTSESKEILHELYSPSEICIYLKEGKQAEKDILAAEESDAIRMAKKKTEEQAHREKVAKELWNWFMMNAGNE